MPLLPVELNKGLATGPDEAATPRGFLRHAREVYFKPDDAQQLWKMRGNSSAGSLGVSTSVYSLHHMQFDGGTNKLVSVAASKVYESNAATSGLAFSTAKDQQGSPADFACTGTRPKAIQDGQNKWWIVSGTNNERPLVRDLDGNWRFAGMLRAATPSLAAVTSTPTTYRPDAAEAGNEWTNPANVYDGSGATYASQTLSEDDLGTDSVIGAWGFTDAGNVPASQTLYVSLRLSLVGTRTCTLQVEVSENNGSSYSTVYYFSGPGGITTTVQKALTGGSPWTSLIVRVTAVYYGPGGSATPKVSEVYVVGSGSGGAITAGTYYYATTEVWSKALSDGSTLEVEGQPSEAVSIPLNGTTHTGVTLTFGTKQNLTTMGYATTDVYYRVYRSTSTGASPNLGLIGQVASSATTFSDSFTTGATTLGAPSIPVLTVGQTNYDQNISPPPLVDAALFKGAVVGIPVGQETHLQYSLPGMPEYWPELHDIASLPSARNDDLQGCEVVGDSLVLWSRTRTFRILDLFFADQPEFDLGRMAIDVLDSDIGLLTPLAYCTARAMNGAPLLFWVAYDGIYFTDGELPKNRGLGVRKATEWLDWPATISAADLTSARLTYDPYDQIIYFDYTDAASAAKTLLLHVGEKHWVPAPSSTLQGSSVVGGWTPKITGPHARTAAARCGGEVSSQIYHWAVSSAGAVTLERTGASSATVFLETGWQQTTGPFGDVRFIEGSVYHSDWGVSQVFSADFWTRREDSGVPQAVSKRGLSLRGSRATAFWIDRSGQSFKLRLQQEGSGSGAFGPAYLRLGGPERAASAERNP
jgi:hypothetical protein